MQTYYKHVGTQSQSFSTPSQLKYLKITREVNVSASWHHRKCKADNLTGQVLTEPQANLCARGEGEKKSLECGQFRESKLLTRSVVTVVGSLYRPSSSFKL